MVFRPQKEIRVPSSKTSPKVRQRAGVLIGLMALLAKADPVRAYRVLGAFVFGALIRCHFLQSSLKGLKGEVGIWSDA